jgi:hypothetical protein
MDKAMYRKDRLLHYLNREPNLLVEVSCDQVKKCFVIKVEAMMEVVCSHNSYTIYEYDSVGRLVCRRVFAYCKRAFTWMKDRMNRRTKSTEEIKEAVELQKQILIMLNSMFQR